MEGKGRVFSLGEELRLVYRYIVNRCEPVCEHFPMEADEKKVSRDNLLAYLALREMDLHPLQLALAEEGLSSLGRMESHVLDGLEKVMSHLQVTTLNVSDPLKRISAREAEEILRRRSERIFGRWHSRRHTHIMVTLDSSILQESGKMAQLLQNGMDLIRINCAHETKEEWIAIIRLLRETETALQSQGKYRNRRCKVYMDLGGPKIRTGMLDTVLYPLHLDVKKNRFGIAPAPLYGYLAIGEKESRFLTAQEGEDAFLLAVSSGDISQLSRGDRLFFMDTRGKERTLRVEEECRDGRVKVSLDETAYISGETIFTKGKRPDPESETGSVPLLFTIYPNQPEPVEIRVRKGEKLRIYRDPSRLGHPATEEEPAGISTQIPEVLAQVKEGERIFIDDGKIEGVVEEVEKDFLLLAILSPEGRGRKVREGKGLNFPDSLIHLPALTEQDKEDLAFVAKHADIVGLSFVHHPEDLFSLRESLLRLGREDLSIVAKIETKEAIRNLARIVMAGLSFPSFGVMIARGDLAVEVGFQNLAQVQEDILDLCEAAHIPVIWATEVLERLAKEGIPARAEITDAAYGQRAECVMLNKGPHIAQAVKMLSTVLETESLAYRKKRQVYIQFTKQRGIFPGS